ncbi:MAG: septum formation protein Maf [Alphaproteobacteria bacterium]|nr:MAG: septum formation protein Maf [Alphaproteobacteria bacterium]
MPASRLVLASVSKVRAALLRAAGVTFEQVAPRLDEEALKAGLRAAGASPRDMADALAQAKAVKISQRRPGRLVLGADQVLAMDGAVFDKAPDPAHAEAYLRLLRGKAHRQISALVIAEDGVAVWRHVGIATLHMRAFSDAFLRAYLEAAGAALTDAVGGYWLEGIGSQLFTRIEGDYFTVLGLPLLPLLDYLRVRGLLAT